LGMEPAAAMEAGLLTPKEKSQLDALAEAARKVIAVDDFAPNELAAMFPGARGSDKSTPPQEAAE